MGRQKGGFECNAQVGIHPRVEGVIASWQPLVTRIAKETKRASFYCCIACADTIWTAVSLPNPLPLVLHC